MKTLHRLKQWKEMESRIDEVPHECDDPRCPGNINRIKLELYEITIKVLEEISCLYDLKYLLAPIIEKAKSIENGEL